MPRRANLSPIAPSLDDAEFVVVMPRPPVDLDDRAIEVWREFAPWLRSDGPIERRVLARYCVATSLWHRAVDDISKHGMVYTVRSRDGNRLAAVREMPAAQHVRTLEAVLRACEQTLRDYIVESSPLSSRSRDR